MAKKTFKGRPVLPGNIEGQALVSKQAFNTTASYFENMFAGNTETAPCTDANNQELFRKDLKDAIICTPQTVGSTMGAGCLMGMNELGVGAKAFLFSSHIDSIAAAGLIMDDIWNNRRVITIDLLGDEFLEAVKTGDPIVIREDGTVEVG
ncbi:aconitase X swivel domain-containing protein [Crocosphaera sp.]|uniref:aconitase X swivel domain-containing protein n=1 Tax=Crocosphaera sp. TaxID=2729996 RepID=UPI003F202B66